MSTAQVLQYQEAKEEADDEADLKGGVGRLGGRGVVAWRASMAMVPCVEGIDGIRDGWSCALTGSGLGDETDGVAWKGASGASSGIRQTLMCAVACRVCATWVSTGS